jgi:hypothetical protein
MKSSIFFILFLLILGNIVFSQEIRELTKEGILEDLGKNEEITFYVVESSSLRIGNPREDSLEKHKFKSLSITPDSVNISVDGEKTNTVIVPLAQTRKVDIDKDNIFDVSITVNYIRSQVASVLFKSIDGSVEKFVSTTPSAPITETVENTTSVSETNNNQEETAQEVVQEPDNKSMTFQELLIPIIIAVLISAIIIICILLIIKFIKKKPKDENPW